MRLMLVLAPLAVSACATPAPTSAALDGRLDALVGQPVEIALARLGEPIASVPMGTDTVYGWGRAFTSTELLSPNIDIAAGGNAQSGVFPPPRRTVQNACVVRMVAGADGRIRDWDVQGDERGCRALSDRLAGQAVAQLD